MGTKLTTAIPWMVLLDCHYIRLVCFLIAMWAMLPVQQCKGLRTLPSATSISSNYYSLLNFSFSYLLSARTSLCLSVWRFCIQLSSVPYAVHSFILYSAFQLLHGQWRCSCLMAAGHLDGVPIGFCNLIFVALYDFCVVCCGEVECSHRYLNIEVLTCSHIWDSHSMR